MASRLWNAVHDLAVADGLDIDAAAKEADKAVHLVEVSRGYDKEMSRERRNVKIKRVAALAGAWSLVPLAIAGIVVGIYFLAQKNNGDYAGYGPHNAIGHGRVAVQAWYGENDAPKSLVVTGEKKATLYGQPAWKIGYRRGDGAPVCAWVWLQGDPVPGSHFGPDDNWLVREGSAC